MSFAGARRPSDMLLGACLAIVVAATIAAAMGLRPPTLGERARRLESELRCPVCQSTSIADSLAPLAAQMREVVQERLAAGATDDEVRAYFVERYGAWILLVPAATGPSLMLWLAPGSAITAAAALLVLHRRRPISRPPHTAPRRVSARVLIGGTAVFLLSVGVPLAIATGPRLGNAALSGRLPGIQSAPSVGELEARVAADPSDAGALLSLGDAYLAGGRAREAGDAYGRVLELEPANGAALVGAAAALLTIGRPDAALTLLDRAVALADTADARLYRALARFQLAGRLTPQARTDALRFLEQAPDDPRTALVRELLGQLPASPAP